MPILPKPFAFVDLETTGMRHLHDRIIEIGILRVEDNTITQTFQSLVNPQIYVAPEIEVLTGISTNDLDSAPTFDSITTKIQEIIDGCIVVAHNVRFDYGFLKHEFRRLGIDFSPKHFCTVKLSKYLFPQYPKHNLDSIIERFNLNCEKRHRAFDDAKVLWDFYQIVQKQFSQEILENTLKRLLKTPSLPANLQSDTLEKLPKSPGVYLFYDAINSPLYIGKSINISNRVRSHFTQDHVRSTEMKISQQIHAIEAVTTAGELGALFTESVLIKQLQPLYNRKLRIKRKMYVLKQKTNVNGYTTLSLEMVGKIHPEDISQIAGIFKSKKQAKDMLIMLAKQYQLCERLLGIEHTNEACFAYRLGWCKGACVKKENPHMYNARCIIAFSKLKIKPWPFRGPIAIREYNQDFEKEEIFFIDKWCLLGSMKKNGQETQQEIEKDIYFDKDTYKILHAYITSPKHTQNISALLSEEVMLLLHGTEENYSSAIT